MKIIRALLTLSSLGGITSASTIIQTKSNIAFLAGNLGSMTFAKFDTSHGEIAVKSAGFIFYNAGRPCDNNGTLGGSFLFRHELEDYITSSTVNIGSSSMSHTTFARSQTNFTIGINDDNEIHPFDIGTSDCSVYNAATKNTTFSAENIDSDSWTNHVRTGTYDIDFKRFNGVPTRE